METQNRSSLTFEQGAGDEQIDPQHHTLLQHPRVLVVVSGGVAEYVSTGDVQVHVFDWDNYKIESEKDGNVPEYFADLAKPLGIPVQFNSGPQAVAALSDSKVPAKKANPYAAGVVKDLASSAQGVETSTPDTPSILDVARFTAYKVFVQDQSRSDHVRGLTLEQVRDETRYPLGPQKDDAERLFVWAYGLNEGEKIV